MVRMVNSGTEAVMSAIRLARGRHRPGQDHQVRGLLPRPHRLPAGERRVLRPGGGHPSSAGVPEDIVKHTLTAQFNDLASVEALLRPDPGQVACVIVEPVAANMGVVGPAPGFLEGLRKLCDKTAPC